MPCQKPNGDFDAYTENHHENDPRRRCRRVFAPAGLGHAAARLTWKHFPAGQNGFFRAPVLVSGPDRSRADRWRLHLPDGKALADAIKATGKKLTTIYISQSDPDYYFSLEAVKDAFPDARVLAAPATLAAIKGSVEKKLAVWGPQLKENGPQTLPTSSSPKRSTATRSRVDGETIEIVSADGLANRRYLFVPSLNAVFGGVHDLLGRPCLDRRHADQGAACRLDRQSRQDRGAQAGDRRARPYDAEAATDLSGVEHTNAYLIAFEEELAKAKDAPRSRRRWKRRFPGLGMGVALDIGAKVATGEMKWG